MSFLKKRIVYLIFPVFFVSFVSAHAMENKSSAVCDRAQMVRYTNVGLKIPFVFAGLQGMDWVVSSALSLCSTEWQNGLYGHESVSAAIVSIIRDELKILGVLELVPITKKSGSFFEGESSFDTLIVHPTDQCIYVDEDFLSKQSEETQRAFIKTALRHYTNNTFMKLIGIKLPFIGLNLVITDALKQGAKEISQKFSPCVIQQEQSPFFFRSIKRLGNVAGNTALDMVIGIGVSYACNGAARGLMNRYTRSKTRVFDCSVAGAQKKEFAGKLLGNLALDEDDFRVKSIESRALDLVDGDASVKNVIDPLKEQLIQVKISKDGIEIGQLLVSLGGLKDKNKEDKVLALVIQKLIDDTLALNNELCSSKGKCTIV